MQYKKRIVRNDGGAEHVTFDSLASSKTTE
jgi:hypothetical protein